jgi:cytochrome c553
VTRIICCLALAALPMLGETPERTIPDIALYYDFQHQPPGAVQKALEQEATSILEPMGETIEWRPLSGVRPGDVAVDLAVLTFKGRCELSQPIPRASGSRTLGLTHISDGIILPFSDIDCDRIRGFLDHELQAVPPEDREFAFGRAVGRVVAHELYHIFANTTHHASSGVARSAFTAKELVAESFRLNEAALLARQASLEDAVPPGKAAAPVPDGRSVFTGSGCMTCHGDRGEGTAKGPALKGGRRVNVLSLGAKLGNMGSAMHRRTRNLKIPVPGFGRNEIRALVNFLNSGFN